LRAAVGSYWITCVGLQVGRFVELDYERGGRGARSVGPQGGRFMEALEFLRPA